MQKKIVLIQPDSPYLLYPLSFPGLGLMYISSYLKKNGYFPDYYDLTGGIKLPEDLHADIFGISCQITQFKDVKKIKDELKEKNPNSLFVIGGPFPTHSPKECLDAGFDVVVKGEGEISMLNIVKNYPNVAKGEYFSEEFLNPDEIFPDWNAINPLRYRYQLEGKKCMNILTKRGNCPFQCTFCAKQEGKRSPLRYRSVENVLDEVKFLKDKFGVGSIAIYDDDVLLDKKRDAELFKGLAELKIPYRCMTRANLATKEDLKLLKETGCGEIAIGVESADPHILEVIKKGITLEQNTEFIKTCKELGLRVKAYLIIGLPGESRETVEKIKKWLRETQPDNFDISVFTPYPGSDIYENKQNYEIDWNEEKLREVWFSGEAQYGTCAVWTPYLSSEEIIKLKEEIEAEFKRGKGGATSYWGPMKDN